MLSVVVPVLVRGVTDDYVLGTFLLVNHPFYIGENIRVNVDDEGEKDYIVRQVTWTTWSSTASTIRRTIRDSGRRCPIPSSSRAQ